VDCSALYSRLRLGIDRRRCHLARSALLAALLFGRRGLAVLVMTLLLFLLFIIPIALLVNSLVDSSAR
jgi:hypothetical protein